MEIKINDVVYVDYSAWKSDSSKSSEVAQYSGIEVYVDKSIDGRIAKVIAIENCLYLVQLLDGKLFHVHKQFCRLLKNAVWNSEQLCSTESYSPFKATHEQVNFTGIKISTRFGYFVFTEPYNH